MIMSVLVWITPLLAVCALLFAAWKAAFVSKANRHNYFLVRPYFYFFKEYFCSRRYKIHPSLYLHNQLPVLL